jgi:hypothetical protein
VSGGVGGDWTELTGGNGPAVRYSAVDLQQATRAAARIRGERPDTAAILDVRVRVTHDVRAARATMLSDHATVTYAGTLDGLTGLVADIELAGVADGVTLILEASPSQLERVGRDVLDLLVLRGRATA